MGMSPSHCDVTNTYMATWYVVRQHCHLTTAQHCRNRTEIVNSRTFFLHFSYDGRTPDNDEGIERPWFLFHGLGTHRRSRTTQVCMHHQYLIPLIVDFGARSRYIRQGHVIASHRILCGAITHPCFWHQSSQMIPCESWYDGCRHRKNRSTWCF